MLQTQLAIVDQLGGLTDYETAWAEQRRLHAEVAAGDRPSTILLVEHPPVFTAGKRTQPGDRPWDGSPVIDVDRGGRITWHGPGQLVGYPIIHLPDPVDVLEYVRRLEAAVMQVTDHFGLRTKRVADRTGVWVTTDERGGERKIAAIGVRVARGVTMHGFALNCNCDLSWYDRIVPCGIPDAGVTSLSRELGRELQIADVAELTKQALADQLQEWAK